MTRVRADKFLKLDEYESFTCLMEGSRLDAPRFDRDEAGKLRYAWRKNASAIDPQEERRLLNAGKIKADDLRWRLRDKTTGKTVTAHHGSVYWNAFRQRWILIAVETGGASSFLGEVWCAEAESPVGPWTTAVKIVTHDRYSFYNPKQHPMFDKDGGRYIFFEGTYTTMFSGNSRPTARYEYNQILYKLDLADPRLR